MNDMERGGKEFGKACDQVGEGNLLIFTVSMDS
jgi:hypothetical protein